MTASRNQETTEKTDGATTPTVRWNTAQLRSSYANVCNVTSTREEVVLNFGINQSWERIQGEMEIQLTNRIILSPFAAKRLSLMLTSLVRGYESRYGDLSIDDASSEAARVQQ